MDRYNPFETGGETDYDPVARILDYPYAQRPGPYLLTRSECRDLDGEAIEAKLAQADNLVDWRAALAAETTLSAADIAGRTLVLASGSNASPRQLQRKFRTMEGDWRVVVLSCEATDIALVYGAMVSGYGAIPATSQYVSGVKSRAFATLLTDAQLAQMHLTEDLGVDYAFVSLRRGAIRLGGRPAPTAGFAYIALSGPLLTASGQLQAISQALDAGGGTNGMIAAPIDQEGAQRLCAQLAYGEPSPDAMMARHIASSDARLETSRRLKERHAAPVHL